MEDVHLGQKEKIVLRPLENNAHKSPSSPIAPSVNNKDSNPDSTQGLLVECDPKGVLQNGLLGFCNALGLTANSIAGGYLINTPSIDPLIGGMMAMDWSQANILESPNVIDDYYKSLQKPYVWWNDSRQVPENFSQRLQMMGLKLIKKMAGLYFDTTKLQAHKRAEHIHHFLVQTAQNFNVFCDLFSVSQPYSADFCRAAIELIRQKGLSRTVAYHVGYYQGEAVSMGSVYSLIDHAFIYHLATTKKVQNLKFDQLMLEELIASANIMGFKYVCLFAPLEQVSFYLNNGFEQAIEFDVFGSQEIFTRFAHQLI